MDDCAFEFRLLRNDSPPVFRRKMLYYPPSGSERRAVFTAEFEEWLGDYGIEPPTVGIGCYHNTPTSARLTFARASDLFLFKLRWL